MRPKDRDGMANSVDRDQIAPSEAVIMGLSLFALSVQTLGSIRYQNVLG